MSRVTSVFAVLVAFFLTSFVEKGVTSDKSLSEGCLAPGFELENLEADSLKGKKILLSFWAAYDAQSRMSNSLLSAGVKDFSDEVKMVSVAYDSDSLIFQETVRIDQLDRNTQYYDRNGKHSEIFRAFRLKDGFANYLINERGVIVAKNLDPKKLHDLMSQVLD